jgi:hypothetical protein
MVLAVFLSTGLVPHPSRIKLAPIGRMTFWIPNPERKCSGLRYRYVV